LTPMATCSSLVNRHEPDISSRKPLVDRSLPYNFNSSRAEMPRLYDTIGATYGGSRRADPFLVDALARLVDVRQSQQYLDVACGTGNYTAALSARGGIWAGIDVSDVMLAQARRNAAGVSWLRATASHLPFRSRAFDGAVCTLAVHHFESLDQPFCEVKRVLRSGAFVLFTGLAEQMLNYWLCHYFPEMMRRSIENMPSEGMVRKALRGAGFGRVERLNFLVKPDLHDLFLYAGKDRPQIYFDGAIRENISSFAKLITEAELNDGLKALAHDIRIGDFERVKAQYDSQDGDYAFFVAHAGG
jgi:ubiquinone/menaquinone biosynthesis C-methylase UbiE